MALKNLKTYILSNEADTDLGEIFDYTESEHNFNQAVKYLSDLKRVFEQLVKNPKLGRERGELKKGIFSITEQEHTIFYQIESKSVLIIRVLHGSKDIRRGTLI